MLWRFSRLVIELTILMISRVADVEVTNLRPLNLCILDRMTVQ